MATFANKRMLIMLAACAVVLGGVFGFKSFARHMANRYFDTVAAPAVTVSTVAATSQSWPLRLTAVGTVRAVTGTDVTTEADGIVDGIHFESGRRVRAGTLLLTLDRSVDEAQLRALEAQAKLARLQVERIHKLYASRAVSASDLDQAQAQAEADEADVAAQQAKIEQKVIRAPFAGVLGIRQVNLGQHLAPGTAIVSLQSLDPVYVDFRLPQQRLSVVRAGLPVEVQVDTGEEHTLRGRITAIAPQVDASTRNFESRATVRNPDQVLKPGMFAEVRVELGPGEEVTVVPQTAIQFSSYGDSVWVIGRAPDGKLNATRRVVTTGRRQGDLVQIVKGLAAGEQVASSGLLKLREGAMVQVDNSIQPAAELASAPPNR
jgi:membrane fusion protein (multidrug efflux system)